MRRIIASETHSFASMCWFMYYGICVARNQQLANSYLWCIGLLQQKHISFQACGISNELYGIGDQLIKEIIIATYTISRVRWNFFWSSCLSQCAMEQKWQILFQESSVRRWSAMNFTYQLLTPFRPSLPSLLHYTLINPTTSS